MLIINDNPKSIGAESYRKLRTNIQYSSFDEEYKVLTVTSSCPGEGKSTTSGNLVLSLASDDKKVIIIDCDMRKPTVHKKFKVSNSLGLSDVLIGKVELKDACHKYDNNITILTAGKIPPNPSEMLSSKSMTALIQALKKVFDYIVLDTPPLQAVTDSQILATKSDGVILVVKAGGAKKDEVRESIDLLKKVNANIMGIVLNGMETTTGNYYYYGGKDESR